MTKIHPFGANKPQIQERKVRIKLFRKYLSSPKIILEFGSYDGADGILYHKSFPTARVFSIEPDPENFENVLRNIKSYKEIRAFHYAISNETGEVDFHQARFYSYADGSSTSRAGSLLKHTSKNQEVYIKTDKFVSKLIKVPAITIKEFCRQQDIKHIDLMHVDVEGAIREVIEGLKDIRPTLIWAEVGDGIMKYYHNTMSNAESDIAFSNIGYTKVKKIGRDTLYHNYKLQEVKD